MRRTDDPLPAAASRRGGGKMPQRGFARGSPRGRAEIAAAVLTEEPHGLRIAPRGAHHVLSGARAAPRGVSGRASADRPRTGGGDARGERAHRPRAPGAAAGGHVLRDALAGAGIDTTGILVRHGYRTPTEARDHLRAQAAAAA